MGIKTSYNAGLGVPLFDRAYPDNADIAPGTIVQGVDSDNFVSHEYMWVQGGASQIDEGDEVSVNASYVAAAETPPDGIGVTLFDIPAGQFAWIRLKVRGA